MPQRAGAMSRPRKIISFITGGAIVVLISFFIMLKVFDYWDSVPNPTTLFKDVDARTADTFERTASIAHLKKSDSLNGYVDAARRLASGELEVYGWSVDRNPAGNPVFLYIFWNGRAVFGARAKGPRTDVTKVLSLSNAAAADVVVKGTSEKVPCEADSSPYGIIVNNQENEFNIIPNLSLPGCN
jgi:hypothetical protein